MLDSLKFPKSPINNTSKECEYGPEWDTAPRTTIYEAGGGGSRGLQGPLVSDAALAASQPAAGWYLNSECDQRTMHYYIQKHNLHWSEEDISSWRDAHL